MNIPNQKLLLNPSLYRFRGKPYTINKMVFEYSGIFAWKVIVTFDDPNNQEILHGRMVDIRGQYSPLDVESEWDVVRKEVKKFAHSRGLEHSWDIILRRKEAENTLTQLNLFT